MRDHSILTMTGKELAEWAKFECGNIQDRSLSHQIIITFMYKSSLALGQEDEARLLAGNLEKNWENFHDVKLTNYCDKTWDI